MEIKEGFPLKKLSALKIGGTAKYYCEIENEDDVSDLLEFSEKNNIPIKIIGEGTNTIFGDGEIKKVVALMKIIGKHKTYDGADFTNIMVGAGEKWDDFVKWTVENNLSGIENLSGIPGTVGAAPVQNIGAYGKEVQDAITNVRVYDKEYDDFLEIPNDQCMFSYRDSIFKINPDRFIITAVSFQLRKIPANTKIEVPKYKDVQLFFLSKNQKEASLEEIRDAIIEIRNKKIPNYQTEPNCGSYFKNPVIPNDVASELIKKFPEMPQFELTNRSVKVFAGWLVEHSALKGFTHKNLKVSEQNSLVVVNTGESLLSDLIEFEKLVIEEVNNKFGIVLEREPNVIQ